VGWMGTEGDWDNAIVMIGDPNNAMQIIFGPDQGGGGAFAVPQASTKAFLSTVYAGTYAALLYQYDTGAASGEEESVLDLAIVITSEGGVRVYNFGDNTADPGGDSPLFEDDTLQPVADYGTGSLAVDLNTTSTLDSAIFAGIKDADLCHGAFIAEGSIDGNDATAVIVFDPDGRFAGFHLFDTDSGDDILGFGLAIKDSNFTNPE
jgi:hypothetical protein